MKRFLQSLQGILLFIGMIFITLFWITILFILLFFKILTPIKNVKKRINHQIHHLQEHWSNSMFFFLNIFIKTQWEIDEGILAKIDKKKSYILIANHISWLDILVLLQAYNKKIPVFRFMMKEELRWQLPILGLVCQFLGFPVVKRYSKEFLEKHPECKGKDVEETKTKLSKLKDIPITVINFAEGHRFSKKWHDKQQSPYQYLLKPRAGGVAFSLAVMQEQIKSFLDVTLFYPSQDTNMFDYLCGRVDKIQVKITEFPITAELIGDYANDLNYRNHFQRWLNEIWLQKDNLLKAHYQTLPH